jgi:hypothetical protein
MKQNRNTNDDAMEELRELLRKSVEANATLTERGGELLKAISEQNISLPELSSRGEEVIRGAFEQYMRMSTAFTSKLIDLGLDVSNQMLDAVRQTAPPPHTAPATGTEKAAPMFDLAVAGRPGETSHTAIMLESDDPEGFEARFLASGVTDMSGNAVQGFVITFDPERLHVRGKAQFTVQVAIPVDIPAASYYSIVTLEGHPRRSFRLIVDVEEAAEKQAAQSTRTASPSQTKAPPARTETPNASASTVKSGKTATPASGAKRKAAASKKSTASKSATAKRGTTKSSTTKSATAKRGTTKSSTTKSASTKKKGRSSGTTSN